MPPLGRTIREGVKLNRLNRSLVALTRYLGIAEVKHADHACRDVVRRVLWQPLLLPTTTVCGW